MDQQVQDHNYKSLSQENLLVYEQGGQRYVWRILSSPEMDLIIDIPNKKFTLEGNHDGSNVDVAKMMNCHFSHSPSPNGADTFQLSLSPVSDWAAYYSFLDLFIRSVLSGLSLADAISESIRTWNELLGRFQSLSQDQEVGLFGELLLLEQLAALDAARALDSWVGPDGEEHDFKFLNLDVEVKTTTSETRRHKIGSISQLLESPNKDLYLMSNQITLAGSGGESLPELVDRILDLFPGHQSLVLLEKLRKINYQHEQSALYSSRWELRDDTKFFLVDANFPRLTTESLQVEPIKLARISEISYRIDLEEFEAKPGLFSDFQKIVSF